MADYMFRFLSSSLLISGILLILFLLKSLLKHTLTSRTQYHLWYIMLALLAVPFLPFPVIEFSPFFLWSNRLTDMTSFSKKFFIGLSINTSTAKAPEPLQDFALSVGRKTPSFIGTFLFGIWLMGILVMIFLILRAWRRFYRIKQSALLLQNKEVRALYQSCLEELKITAEIPIYSTAFLKTPVIAGLFRPCIYLPISLIMNCPAHRLRYMLLHELQHFRHRDALTGFLMDLAGILYWFHPLVWYALREMRSDRETACDASVLALLQESDYEDYGYTLLALAQKNALAPFPFATGISGSMRQMQKRIVHISAYQKPSSWKKAKSSFFFCVLTVFLLGFTPMLSTCAADQSSYKWNTSSKTISMMDLSSYFQGYRGSFVLYNLTADTWNIYDMEQAVFRVPPNSTYKIYDALFGMEEGIITPQDSYMAWDGIAHPFEAWNADQDLNSAMSASVNWYFQKIDEQLGRPVIKRRIQEIGYGNEEIRFDLSSYWMDSSLKISPVEQVELLTDLYQNRLDFAPETIDALKQSICLSSSENDSFYGKTGTGRINEQDVSGWFIGFAETNGNVFFFAAHIQGDTGASGSKAAEITRTVLSDMQVISPEL